MLVAPGPSGWRARINGLRERSVWAHDFMPGTDPKVVSARVTMRVWYPLYYLLSSLLGLWAWLLGSPTLVRNFEPWLVDVSGITLMVVGGATLVAANVPVLGRVEFGGLVVMAFMEGCFAGILIAIPPSEPTVPVNLFIFTFLLMAVVPLAPRATYFTVKSFVDRGLRKAATE